MCHVGIIHPANNAALPASFAVYGIASSDVVRVEGEKTNFNADIATKLEPIGGNNFLWVVTYRNVRDVVAPATLTIKGYKADTTVGATESRTFTLELQNLAANLQIRHIEPEATGVPKNFVAYGKYNASLVGLTTTTFTASVTDATILTPAFQKEEPTGNDAFWFAAFKNLAANTAYTLLVRFGVQESRDFTTGA